MRQTASLVGNKPAGDNPFDLPGNKAPNPLATAGAIALASELGKGEAAHERSRRLFEALTKLSGSSVGCNMAVYLAGTADQSATAALAHWMVRQLSSSHALLPCCLSAADDVQESKDLVSDATEALSLYQQAYSGLVTCETLATIGATLANNGVCPKSSQCVPTLPTSIPPFPPLSSSPTLPPLSPLTGVVGKQSARKRRRRRRR